MLHIEYRTTVAIAEHLEYDNCRAKLLMDNDIYILRIGWIMTNSHTNQMSNGKHLETSSFMKHTTRGN